MSRSGPSSRLPALADGRPSRKLASAFPCVALGTSGLAWVHSLSKLNVPPEAPWGWEATAPIVRQSAPTFVVWRPTSFERRAVHVPLRIIHDRFSTIAERPAGADAVTLNGAVRISPVLNRAHVARRKPELAHLERVPQHMVVEPRVSIAQARRRRRIRAPSCC